MLWVLPDVREARCGEEIQEASQARGQGAQKTSGESCYSGAEGAYEAE